MIRKFVQQAFENEYLSTEAEFKIRDLFYKNCQLEDVDRLIDLQQAINYGYIQQESKKTHGSHLDLLVSHF